MSLRIAFVAVRMRQIQFCGYAANSGLEIVRLRMSLPSYNNFGNKHRHMPT